jgi:hypothetical protein
MAIVNITTYNDADFGRTFIWKTYAGVPIDLSGGAMEMMLRKHASDQAAVLRLATDTGEIVFDDPYAGKFTVRIAQAELERLGVGEFEHSNIFSKAGAKTRVWSGAFTNNAGATR